MTQAYGLPIPQTFTSNMVRTAKDYPMRGAPATDGTGQTVESGNVTCQDGTLPPRACFDVMCHKGKRQWKKKPEKGNNHQRSWLPEHLHAFAIRLRACTIEATQDQNLEYVAVFTGFLDKQLANRVLNSLDSWVPEERYSHFGLPVSGEQPGALKGFIAAGSSDQGSEHPGDPHQANPGAAPSSVILSRHYLLATGDFNEFGDVNGYSRKRMLAGKVVCRPSFICVGRVLTRH